MEPRRAIYYLAVLLITLCGCQNLVPHDTPSLLNPKFQRSEVVGIVEEKTPGVTGQRISVTRRSKP